MEETLTLPEINQKKVTFHSTIKKKEDYEHYALKLTDYPQNP